MGPLRGVVAGWLALVRRRRAARPQPAIAVAEPPPRPTAEVREGDSSLEAGLRDIRRMDRKFDPDRFTGYIEMLFRRAHTARMSRDVASLREHVTPALYAELLAQCDRLRSRGHVSHVDDIEIRAQVTRAWHAEGRDYVTARIAGAMLDYTVDESTGALVAGSKTPEPVEAVWTFTRPAGLNPWTLSAIQAA